MRVKDYESTASLAQQFSSTLIEGSGIAEQIARDAIGNIQKQIAQAQHDLPRARGLHSRLLSYLEETACTE